MSSIAKSNGKHITYCIVQKNPVNEIYRFTVDTKKRWKSRDFISNLSNTHLLFFQKERPHLSPGAIAGTTGGSRYETDNIAHRFY